MSVFVYNECPISDITIKKAFCGDSGEIIHPQEAMLVQVDVMGEGQGEFGIYLHFEGESDKNPFFDLEIHGLEGLEQGGYIDY